MERRNQEYVGRKALWMVPPGRRRGGRPKKRLMDCVNRNMSAIWTANDDIRDITAWRRIVSGAATLHKDDGCVCLARMMLPGEAELASE